MSDQPLIRYGSESKPFYIAVSKHGFGIDKVPAMAIRLAQTEVPAAAKESQLLVYRAPEAIEPRDFKRGTPIWPNGDRPALCGLTSTHRGFRQQPKI